MNIYNKNQEWRFFAILDAYQSCYPIFPVMTIVLVPGVKAQTPVVGS